MIEASFEIDLSLDGGTDMSGVEVGPDDHLYYRFEDQSASVLTTAVVSYYTKRSTREPWHETGTLVIDGDPQTLSIKAFNYLKFGTTTPETGKKGVLHIFTRKDQE